VGQRSTQELCRGGESTSRRGLRAEPAEKRVKKVDQAEGTVCAQARKYRYLSETTESPSNKGNAN
jgi:hypothetical protein